MWAKDLPASLKNLQESSNKQKISVMLCSDNIAVCVVIPIANTQKYRYMIHF